MIRSVVLSRTMGELRDARPSARAEVGAQAPPARPAGPRPHPRETGADANEANHGGDCLPSDPGDHHRVQSDSREHQSDRQRGGCGPPGGLRPDDDHHVLKADQDGGEEPGGEQEDERAKDQAERSGQLRPAPRDEHPRRRCDDRHDRHLEPDQPGGAAHHLSDGRRRLGAARSRCHLSAEDRVDPEVEQPEQPQHLSDDEPQAIFLRAEPAEQERHQHQPDEGDGDLEAVAQHQGVRESAGARHWGRRLRRATNTARAIAGGSARRPPWSKPRSDKRRGQG